tara:strand:+ start:30098 stop:30490 length:393 start_codon:yes stop_codon:yes gene_type:complete
MISRIITGFLIAPLTVPISFSIVGFLARGNFESHTFIGSFLAVGIYAYIFSLVLGIPTLLILMKMNKLQLIHFIIAGLLLSVTPCLFFYFVFGLVKINFYIQCVISTLLSVVVFWTIIFKLFKNEPQLTN